MRLTLFFCFTILSFSLYGQILRGKVYDSVSTVKNIKVHNLSQKSVTLTDDNGDFTIIAKENDTIRFQSLFYHPKIVVLQSIHFEGVAVFELKKIVSELDEVEIKAEPEQPIFEEETYNIELKNLIAEDIKNHPEKYQPAGATYGVDFIYLIGQVAKLFKGKKSKIPEYQPISYEQMDSLFTKSSFFNERLLTENLQIPKKQTKLFLDFCAAKQISTELLAENKKMQLLDQLVINSQLFLILLEQYGEENVIKD
tara:strand:- start:681 stop:1442 length:762 start_codon:yes stop_codon:yes gene_type:complete